MDYLGPVPRARRVCRIHSLHRNPRLCPGGPAKRRHVQAVIPVGGRNTCVGPRTHLNNRTYILTNNLRMAPQMLPGTRTRAPESTRYVAKGRSPCDVYLAS